MGGIYWSSNHDKIERRDPPAKRGKGQAAMLVLTFRVGPTPYAVPVRQVVEVVPRVALRPVPHSPPCVLGLLHYRGAAVPVIDLGTLLGGTPCVERLDTRILLVRGGTGESATGRIGLLAEGVNDLVTVSDDRPAMLAPQIPHAPYLGQVFETEGGLLQLIDPDRIALGDVAEAARRIES